MMAWSHAHTHIGFATGAAGDRAEREPSTCSRHKTPSKSQKGREAQEIAISYAKKSLCMQRQKI